MADIIIYGWIGKDEDGVILELDFLRTFFQVRLIEVASRSNITVTCTFTVVAISIIVDIS